MKAQCLITGAPLEQQFYTASGKWEADSRHEKTIVMQNLPSSRTGLIHSQFVSVHFEFSVTH